MFLIIAYQAPQNKSSACLNKNYKFLGSQRFIKHHNSLFQQPHLRQALDVPNCRPCKDIGLYRVPLRQPDDLRCAGCKVKSDLSPFAADSCSDLLVFLLDMNNAPFVIDSVFISLSLTKGAYQIRNGGDFVVF